MEDAEWQIDLIVRTLSPQQFGKLTVEQQKEYLQQQEARRDLDYKHIRSQVQVEPPKGMIITVVRTRAYKGHKMTKVSLEEPVTSFQTPIFDKIYGPQYSSVWIVDLAAGDYYRVVK